MGREKLVRVRLTEEEEIALDLMVKELKEKGRGIKNASELIRFSLQEFYKHYLQSEGGNSTMTLKTKGLEAQQIKDIYAGISRLLKESKAEGQEKQTVFYESMKGELKFSTSKILEDTNKIAKESLLAEISNI